MPNEIPAAVALLTLGGSLPTVRLRLALALLEQAAATLELPEAA